MCSNKTYQPENACFLTEIIEKDTKQNGEAIASYFAVIIQVLQPLDSHISDVAAAKQDFA